MGLQASKGYACHCATDGEPSSLQSSGLIVRKQARPVPVSYSLL